MSEEGQFLAGQDASVGKCELCDQRNASHVWYDEPGYLYWVVCSECSQNRMELRQDQVYIGKIDRSRFASYNERGEP